MELKLVARKVGVFRIPIEFYYRFFFEKGRIKITSLALLPGDKQVHFLIEWLGCFLN
jgi:transcription-repair coupling factor (superfamily II helicase)